MKKKSFPLAKVYGLLEPGPVVLLSTARRGKNNVMTLSWHTMLEFEPPLVGCVVCGYSHAALKATKECVINIPDASLADQVVACGNHSGRDIDKFAAFGLTPLPAAQVKAPLIAECFANLECRVVDTRLVNRYSFFVLEVVQAWADGDIAERQTMHHRGYGKFMFAGETRQLDSQMR